MKWLISKKVRAVNTSSATTETADRRNRVPARGKEEAAGKGQRNETPVESGELSERINLRVNDATSRKTNGKTANEDSFWMGKTSLASGAARRADKTPVGDNLTVLLGQLYFSKISWARSSPPSVNIIIILLQLALGALVSWGTGRGGGRRQVRRQAGKKEEKQKNRIVIVPGRM